MWGKVEARHWSAGDATNVCIKSIARRTGRQYAGYQGHHAYADQRALYACHGELERAPWRQHGGDDDDCCGCTREQRAVAVYAAQDMREAGVECDPDAEKREWKTAAAPMKVPTIRKKARSSSRPRDACATTHTGMAAQKAFCTWNIAAMANDSHAANANTIALTTMSRSISRKLPIRARGFNWRFALSAMPNGRHSRVAPIISATSPLPCGWKRSGSVPFILRSLGDLSDMGLAEW